MSESRSKSGCPSPQLLAGYARGMLPDAEAEQVTLHVSECEPCEATVAEFSSVSALKLVDLLQAAADRQPFVDETECARVVERLLNQRPIAGDFRLLADFDADSGAQSVTLREFVDSATTLGLVTPEEAAAQLATLPETQRSDDDVVGARAFAVGLIQAGKLTEFQAATILTGRGRSLVFGEYLLVERCGSGGMGHVFQARHRRMDRVVALKVMSAKALAGTDALKRFEREARAAAKLVHPHIVHAYDAGSQDGVPYLVMEYVAGCDLATLLKRDGKLDVRRACDYLAQAARGLAFAHEQGIVHRDIKPGNLLVAEPSGIVKVLDLGLARFQEPGVGQPLPTGELTTGELANSELTNSGALMGTVDYMAPEQALNTSRADAKADVYSLGCTLFRLLTGENVFAGETMMEKLIAHREQTPRRLRELRPDAPPALDELVATMLAKTPTARPTMNDVATTLASFAASSNNAARNGKKSQPSTASRRRRMVLGAAFSSAALVALAFVLWRGQTPRDSVIKPGGTTGISTATNLGNSRHAVDSLGPAAEVQKPNLYIYPDPYIPSRKTIIVDSVHFEEEGPMTIEAWVVAEPNESMKAFFESGRKTPINSSDLPAFFEFGGGALFANARAAWEIHPMMPDVRQVGFGFRTSAPKDLVSFSGQLIGSEQGNTTSWHHIAVSIGAYANGLRIVRRWWDGVAVDPPVFSMLIVDDPAEYLRSDGFIDELRVSRSERYLTEFKPERRSTADADTIALYHCDEGEGDVLVDASGHGNHGKLVGARWASVDRFPTAAPRSAPIIPWTKPPRSSVVTMPALPAPKPAPKSSTPEVAAVKTNADGTPRDNLFVYPDKFDINEPIITLDAIHDDFPEGYTIEAWTVADETLSVSLREHFNRSARSAAQPAFFEFNHTPGIQSTARATWKVLGQGFSAERRYYLSNRLKAPPQQTLGRGVTFNNFQLMNDWQTQPELNHIAISFGPVVDGKQTSTYWWNGAGIPSTFAIPFIHDPLDVLRSHGYIDELRVSKGERYKKEFVPRRRFEPDADTIALYHCDEGSGDVLIDSSGHQRHGRIKNAKWASVASYPTAPPRLRGDEAKRMIERTAAENLYVYSDPFDAAVPTIQIDSLRFDDSTPLTIEAWIVPDATPSLVEYFTRRQVPASESPAFFEFAGSGVPQARASWSLQPTHIIGRQVRLGQKTLATGLKPLDERVEFRETELYSSPGGEMHHVAICFGTTANKTRVVTHWIDGIEGQVVRSNLPVVHDPRDVFRSFGFIDELRVSSKVRYDAPFKPTRRFVSDPDTLALYHCDEGSGDILYDSSGRDHHGRLTNAKWASASKFPVFARKNQPLAKTPTDDAASVDDLFIYNDPFDPKVPIIDVDSIRYDGSTPLTIEAWIVPASMHGIGLPPGLPDAQPVTAFELGGSEVPFAAVKWPASAAKSPDIMFLATQKFPAHPSSRTGMPAPSMGMLGRGKSDELQHVALTFGRLENGKQYIARWWNGERADSMARGFIVPHYDARDHLRSGGFIDELRISKVELYKEKFEPKRRFETDADTLALYHCDEGSGDVLIDSSGNRRHGRLKNAKWAPVSSYSIAPLGIPSRERHFAHRRWVGGSSPDEPAALAVEPLPREVSERGPNMFFIRLVNDSDRPLKLSSLENVPLWRPVLIVNCALEFLALPPDPMPASRLTRSKEPGVFRFQDGWSLVTDRFELAPGEWEAFGVEVPTQNLPVGRYRVRCRIIPHSGLGKEQEAAFEFFVVDKFPAALDATPGKTVQWTSEGLQPLPEAIRFPPAK